MVVDTLQSFFCRVRTAHHLLIVKRYIFICIVFILFGLTMQQARGEISETVSGSLTSGRYSWQYGYRIYFYENRLLIRVGVHLVAAPGVTGMQLAKVQPAWEKEIERVWSNRFALVTGNGSYPIVVDVVFKGASLRHDVIVLPGGGRRSDELTWHVMDTPQTAAHEFGHMLGLYDEYVGGAQDPRGKVYDLDSIMTSCPVTGRSYARHYEQFKQWFIKKTGQEDVTLQALGE